MSFSVFATTRFVAFHRWKGAKGDFKYLNLPHRHEFHVKVKVRVQQSDRDVEFHELKIALNETIGILFEKNLQIEKQRNPVPITESCEDMAKRIGRHLEETTTYYEVVSVEVSEDGECGGIWINEGYIDD